MRARQFDEGRPLTEAELRVQRCLEQLVVPEWYKKYSRPSQILKNCIPFECRPSSWKTVKVKETILPRKTYKNQSPKCQPKNVQPTEISPPNIINQLKGYSNYTYKASSEQKSLHNSLTNLNSNSYPRVSRSRKVENINIVFPREEQVSIASQTSASSISRTVYTITKSWSLVQGSQYSMTHPINNSHTSFLIAEVKPSGVNTRVRAFADFEDSEIESFESSSSSPSSACFLDSVKISQKSECNVQSERQDTWQCNLNLAHEIICELEQSATLSCLTSGNSDSQSLVRSIVNALENRANYFEEDAEHCSNILNNSDLSKSMSISFKLCDSMEELLVTYPSYDEEQEKEPYWIPCKVRQLPRTSSLLSMLSRGSSRNSRPRSNSPNLSPIKREQREDSIYQQQQQPFAPMFKSWGPKLDKDSRQLFKIDETVIADSGYSDRSEAISTKTSTLSSDGAIRRLSPIFSEFTSSGILERSAYSNRLFNISAPYVFKSFYV